MTNYQVLARKWRPQRFKELMGQAHVVKTIQNALSMDRVAHAYLFIGPRGVGKTSIARIFAKILNCEKTKQDTRRTEPCCACQTCIEIAKGNCLDVLEIDGASHNSVEDIRSLRDTVQYSPSNGRTYKIYIIDEVHMLSSAAWNALLKTLEEPPEHVKFLFATTEAHKVLPTILSRCQRFDLNPLDTSIIVEGLQQLANDEAIYIEEDALNLIARTAEGSMRDALSILEQLFAFYNKEATNSTINSEDLVTVFGLTPTTELYTLIQMILTNNSVELIRSIHQLANSGRNLERLYADLLQALRNVMIYHILGDTDSRFMFSKYEQDRLKTSFSISVNPTVLQRVINNLLDRENGIHNAMNKRVFIEASLLRAMREAHSSICIDDLIQQLKHLQTGTELPSSTREKQIASSPIEEPVNKEQTPTVNEEKKRSYIQQVYDLFDGKTI